MAVITYTCDTCKRDIDVIENKTGIDVIGPCIITSGCHGHLYKTDYKQDWIRSSYPDSVIGLTNWSKRKALYIHSQTLLQSKWIIPHNMATLPVFIVYLKQEDGSYLEVKPKSTNTVDLNTTELFFEFPCNGIVHCITPTTQSTKSKVVTSEADIQVSSNGVITLATTNQAELIEFGLKFSMDSQPLLVALDNKLTSSSTWYTSSTAITTPRINGTRYVLRDVYVQGVYASEIPNFTTINFYAFTNDEMVTLKLNEMLILYAKSPYTTNDKLIDRYIDCARLNQTLYFKNGEWYTKPSQVIKTYPYIV